MVCSASAEWVEITGSDRDAEYQVVTAALESHWKHAERGWCRVHVDTGVDLRGILEIETCWADSRVGVQIREAHQGKPIGPVEVIHAYGPKESWTYYPAPSVNSMTGYGGIQIRQIDPQYETRPHRTWHSTTLSDKPGLTHLNMIKANPGSRLFRSTDRNHVRVQYGPHSIDFDVASNYSPVLFQRYMEVVGSPRPGRIPMKKEYGIARDRHGQWYCNSMTVTEWPQGMDEPSIASRIYTVLEYDSNPSPERMRLDYKSIGASPDTKVTSFVPGRSGSWEYGRGGGNQVDIEENQLRELSKKQRERGFPAQKEVQP